MLKQIKIENKFIGKNQPVFIIAEAGVNFNGDLGIAKRLIDEAATAGADAVKFQTFKAELLVTDSAPQADYQAKNIGKTESQSAMLKRLELPRQWHAELMDYCRQKKIIFLSAPFSEDDADFLESINVPAFKIPSGEINNFPYLENLAKKGKPIILATGMSSLEEVKSALKIFDKAGNHNVVVLHCTSNYPASPRSLNLRAIPTLQTETGGLVGYSDHSVGYIADIAAAALGACVIEKHFTLDKNMEGPDHKASLNPKELRAMVKAVREAELMLGSSEKKITSEELSTRNVARKSVISKRKIARGAIISKDDLIIKRPGNGIPPTRLNDVVGKKARINIAVDTLIMEEDLI